MAGRFSVNDPKPAAGTPLLIPDQTGVTVRAQGQNTVQFTGFGLRPGAATGHRRRPAAGPGAAIGRSFARA